MGDTGRVAGAVVLMVLLVGCAAAGPPDHAAAELPSAPPISVADLPEGPPSSYPWLAGGLLQVGSVSIRIEAESVVFRGGTTLVGVTDDHHSRWWLFDEDRLVPLHDEATPYVVPVLSADGGTVAWRSDEASTVVDELTRHLVWEVVAYDVPTRSVLGRTHLEGDVRCCDQGGMLFVAGVANDGRVSLSGGPAGGLSTWRPGDAPVTVIRGPVGYVGADSWPLGVSYLLPCDSGERVRFGRVDERGVVTELGRAPQSGVWSEDGRRIAVHQVGASGPTGHLQVVEPLTGETVVLGLPPAATWTVLAWEDETHLIAAQVRTRDTGDPTYTSVVRCDAVSGACERVSRAAAPG